MLIDDTEQYREIWDEVYQRLSFSPSCEYRGHSLAVPLPFQIEGAHSVYGIEGMTAEQQELLTDAIREIFLRVTEEGQKIYALDWRHSAFLYDPRDLSQQESVRVEDPRYMGGGYWAYFPDFYPDGDYYFFIEENFKFGYLGHPWRQEIWIFGEALMGEMEAVYQDLGWDKLK